MSQELATIIDREAFEMRTWTTDLASVSLVPPQGGWHQNQVESGGSVEQSEAYQQYALQRDSQAAAMQVIKELHYASNAETATRGESPPQPQLRADSVSSPTSRRCPATDEILPQCRHRISTTVLLVHSPFYGCR